MKKHNTSQLNLKGYTDGVKGTSIKEIESVGGL